jgi:uncharacterized protein (TIGR02246 family)
MKLFRTLLLAAVCLLALSAGADTSAGRTPPSPADAVRAADQEWMKVFAAKDLDKSVAFCAEDGSVLAPNAPIATGREAIRKLFAGFFALPGLSISWQPSKAEVAKSGELAYTTGTYQMSYNGAAGKQVTDKGKYVTVWKKQGDGSWKVLADIFNSDLPAAP